MADFSISEIHLLQYRVPSITAYNRIEVSPRRTDFDRSLKAEIRDPLWLLTRQWQFGEFQGEDAGTAVTTKIAGDHWAPNQFLSGDGPAKPIQDNVPMEMIVERQPLQPSMGLAVQIARYFSRLLKNNANGGGLMARLVNDYPLQYDLHPGDREGRALLSAASGRLFDGVLFYHNFTSGALDSGLSTAMAGELDSLKAWYERTYQQPSSDETSTWKPSQLEYSFEISNSSGNGGRSLVADRYNGEHLDWYSFDSNISTGPDAGETSTSTQSYIPSPVRFRGMPEPRYWMMEESLTDFGKIDTTTTGLLHLLFAEFGLIASTDWMILPYLLEVNTVCQIRGIVVTDVFGENILIRSAGEGDENKWERWTLFRQSERNKGGAPGNSVFYLPPAVTKTIEGAPVEQVIFMRDDAANMVWAVEKIIPSAAGFGVNGDEFVRRKADPVVAPVTAEKPVVKYVLAETTPDNWIPFVPRKISEDNAEVRLQRASIPGTTGANGQLLSEIPAPYFIDEEIILRSGVDVSMSFQFTRWINGKTFLWYRRKKQNGKGEGRGRFGFDQLKEE